jgi:hypothetical protein
MSSILASLTVVIVDNSLRFVKNFSRFVLKGLATHVYNSLGFDPFAGLGTVPLRAIKLRRKGLGVELSPQYFRDACFYCEAAERQMATPSLFDLLESEVEESVTA